MEINPEDTESQTNQSDYNPDWVTNLVIQLTHTLRIAHLIEDNFDTASSAWVLKVNYIIVGINPLKDGEMIITGEAKNTFSNLF